MDINVTTTNLYGKTLNLRTVDPDTHKCVELPQFPRCREYIRYIYFCCSLLGGMLRSVRLLIAGL